MPATYDKIATTTLSSATNTITFNSIAASWTDIEIVFFGICSSTGEELRLRFNGDTSSQYSSVRIRGNGSTATPTKNNSDTMIPLCVVSPASVPLFAKATVFSYAGSTNKSVLAESSESTASAGWVSRSCGLWRNTNPITSINLSVGVGNFQTGTTATIYGILRA